MLDGTIARLKRELLAGEDFGAIMRTFLDEIERDPALLDRSEPCASPELEATLPRVVEEMVPPGAEADVEGACWLRVRDAGLIHGGFLVGGRVGTAIFFPDVGAGLIAVIARPGGGMRYARFRALAALRGDPGLN